MFSGRRLLSTTLTLGSDSPLVEWVLSITHESVSVDDLAGYGLRAFVDAVLWSLSALDNSIAYPAGALTASRVSNVTFLSNMVLSSNMSVVADTPFAEPCSQVYVRDFCTSGGAWALNTSDCMTANCTESVVNASATEQAVRIGLTAAPTPSPPIAGDGATSYESIGTAVIDGLTCADFGSKTILVAALTKAIKRTVLVFGEEIPTGALYVNTSCCGVGYNTSAVDLQYVLTLEAVWLQEFTDLLLSDSTARTTLAVEDTLAEAIVASSADVPSNFVYWMVHDLDTAADLLTAGVYVSESEVGSAAVTLAPVPHSHTSSDSSGVVVMVVMVSAFAVILICVKLISNHNAGVALNERRKKFVAK